MKEIFFLKIYKEYASIKTAKMWLAILTSSSEIGRFAKICARIIKNILNYLFNVK